LLIQKSPSARITSKITPQLTAHATHILTI
jgi:hypothetical protein